MIHKHDVIIFIARVQPPHKAHVDIINKALELGNHVIILIGSANQPRTIKDPWTWQERAEMLISCIPEKDTRFWMDRVSIIPIENRMYNDQQWAVDVQNAITKRLDSLKITPEKISIIGHFKDRSSYYLRMFPQWHSINVGNIQDLNSTFIRNNLFSIKNTASSPLSSNILKHIEELTRQTEGAIPENILSYLTSFMYRPEFAELVAEYEFIKNYKKAWAKAPYPPTFSTADAVVIQSGHVLMVRRRSSPGKGLLALPGGFLGEHETTLDAAIRELREETKLKVPVPILKGSMRSTRVFDHPDRSLRGRTITHAFLIELEPGPLPQVKGSDDAEKAHWVPLGVLENNLRSQIFEDHYDIIMYFLGRI